MISKSLVAALSILSEDSVIAAGATKMKDALDSRIKRATQGDKTTAETLAKPGGGLGGAAVRAMNVSFDDLEQVMGKYMAKKVRQSWSEKERGPGVSSNGDLVISGMQVGNIWITVQPLLGVEGDPMRLLFQRDLTPHPQYCASYEFMKLPEEKGGIGAQGVIHLGMHGTVEWLPGQPLGNDRQSWSDELLDSLPNIYVYAANNPSESILAKRRGYGTLVSYNVPPYGRAGLYLELANLKDLVSEYRTGQSGDLKQPIWNTCQRCGIDNEVPLLLVEGDKESKITDADLPDMLSSEVFNQWVKELSEYLELLQERLFSSGLHVLGSKPSNDDLKAYLSAYFDDSLSDAEIESAMRPTHQHKEQRWALLQPIIDFVKHLGINIHSQKDVLASDRRETIETAQQIVSLLSRNTEELDGVLTALDGGYVLPAPGGDLLRDGIAVLPTGRNIHALDPYRMPAAGAWIRGKSFCKTSHQNVGNAAKYSHNYIFIDRTNDCRRNNQTAFG